mgnify:CR=1 FL=1
MRYDSARLTGFSTNYDSKRRGSIDSTFFVLVLLLLAAGVVMVLSSSFARAYYDPGNITGGNAAYYFTRQLLFAVLGTAAMIAASKFPMGFYRRYAWHFMAVTVVLLMLVPVIGVKANGSRRWLGIGGLTLQPSELAKLGVILCFSSLICRMRGRMSTFKYGILPFAAILGLVVGLLVLEPHFSASIIIIAVGGVMMFLGGVRLGWFIGAGSAAAVGIGVLLMLFPYASGRINTWRDPFSSSSDEGYQIVQSLYTIGSGGLSGLGLGMSRQKYLYLPEEHNDFIFAIICEELGLFGAVSVILIFLFMLYRFMVIAGNAPDLFGALLVVGVMAHIAIQVVLNIAVVTNVIPNTGITLPFISYGGTSVLFLMIEMGMVLSVSNQIRLES